MTEEHVHDWVVGVKHDTYEPYAFCRETDAELDQHEIAIRLNEYETLKKATEVLKSDCQVFASWTRDFLISEINDLRRKERNDRLGGAEQEDLKWAENHLEKIDKHYPRAKYSKESIYWHFHKREEDEAYADALEEQDDET